MGKKSRLKKEKTLRKTGDADVKTPTAETQITAPDWRKHLIVFIILGILISIAYSPSLKGSLALDDTKIISARAVTADNFPPLLRYRSISYITFYLNRLIGEPFELNVRLTNILIHFINSFLIYMLALITLRLKLSKDEIASSRSFGIRNDMRGAFLEQRYKFFAAATCAFIFALHPININAVAYIVQRMASLATLFVLLSLISYIYASLSEKKTKKWIFYSLSAVSLIFGIFSKENAVMGIPLILLYDYVFLSKLNTRLFLRKTLPAASISTALLIIVSISLNFHKTIFELLGIFFNLNQPFAHRGWISTDVSWTPLQHILTEFRVVSRYVFLIFVPLPKFLVFDWWGYPVSKSLSTPPTTLLSMIFISGIISLSIIKRKKYPFLFFGILWYFIAISLESFIAVGSDLYFEHRNYLPMAGFTIGLVIQSLTPIKSLSEQKNKIVLITVSILILTMGIFTFQRNFIWQDFHALWVETTEKAPTNTRAFVTVGKNYFVTSEFDKAEYYFKGSLNYALGMKQSYFYQESALYLGKIYLIKGDIKKAEEVVSVFNKRVPGSHRLKILKGIYLSAKGEPDKASVFYSQALSQIEKEHNKVHFLLNLGIADISRQTGRLEQAITAYEDSIKKHPINPLAHYGLAMVFISQEDINKADEHLDKTLTVHPENILALSAKAQLVLSTKKDADEALVYAQKALSSSPPFYEPYLTMGFILTYQGKDKEADIYFEKSKTVWNPASEYKINFTKAHAYSLKGDRGSSDIYFKKVLNDRNTPEKTKKSINRRFSQ